jgi:hypothetical protein
MFDPSLRMQDLYLSLAVGLVVGLMIAIRKGYPTSWWSFGINVFLNILSPWMLVTTWLVSINEYPKIVGSPCLFAMFTVMNIFFIYRLVMKGKPSHELAG